LHQQPQTDTSRIGAVVPKRWARKAVTRNLIKRQIYALAREPWTSDLPWADRVIRLRKTFDNKLFISANSEKLRHAIRSELHQLMEQVVAP
jgi:ribonuclease P protein component